MEIASKPVNSVKLLGDRDIVIDRGKEGVSECAQ